MARSLFGGRVGDTVASLYNLGSRQVYTLPVDANGDPSSVTLQVWDAPDGEQLTDLLAADGSTAITTVVVPATGVMPEFYGPDGVNVSVYVLDPDGDYYRLDARADDAAQVAAAAAAEATAAAAELAAVEATNDGIMTAVAEDPESAFATALSASMGLNMADDDSALAQETEARIGVTVPSLVNEVAATYLSSQTVFDRFNTAATPITTTTSGHVYRADEGTVNVAGGVAVASANAASAVTVDAGTAYQTVGIDLYVGDTTAVDHGIRMCVGAATNTYLVLTVQPGGAGAKLGKVVGGTFTQLAVLTEPGQASGTFTITTGTTMRMEMTVTRTGGVICKRDGVVYLTHQLSSGDMTTFLSNTRHGFYLKRTAWSVDNFTVVSSVNTLDPYLAGVDYPGLVVPGGTVLDGFKVDGGLATTLTGQTWNTVTGSVVASAGVAKTTADSEGRVGINFRVPPLQIEGDFYVGSAAGDHGLVFCSNGGTTYLVYLVQPGVGGRLGKVVSGTYTALATLTQPGQATGYYEVNTGTTIHVKATITASGLVTCYRNDEIVGTHQLSAGDMTTFMSNTYAGFYLKRKAWSFDNFRVGPILAPEDPTVLSRMLGPITAYSEINQAANGHGHKIEVGAGIENVLALKNRSTANERYAAMAMLDENDQPKTTYGFGMRSSIVWKRRAYIETWEGPAANGEVPDFILAQTYVTGGYRPMVRLRAIGATGGGALGDFVIYKPVHWSSDAEPANSRALVVKPDGTVIVETPGAGIQARSADGTLYKLVPPNGGGAATWVAV